MSQLAGQNRRRRSQRAGGRVPCLHGGEGPVLAQVVVDRPAAHVLEDDAEIRLAGAGADELDHVLVPDLSHDGYLGRGRRGREGFAPGAVSGRDQSRRHRCSME